MEGNRIRMATREELGVTYFNICSWKWPVLIFQGVEATYFNISGCGGDLSDDSGCGGHHLNNLRSGGGLFNVSGCGGDLSAPSGSWFHIFQGVEVTFQHSLVVLFHIFQGVEATYQRPLVVLFHLTSLCRTGGTPSVFGRSTGTPAASSTSSSWTSN